MHKGMETIGEEEHYHQSMPANLEDLHQESNAPDVVDHADKKVANRRIRQTHKNMADRNKGSLFSNGFQPTLPISTLCVIKRKFAFLGRNRLKLHL